MFYLVLLCIFLLVTASLPGIIQVITATRARRHVPPPPPRGFRPVVIQGGKQGVRKVS